MSKPKDGYRLATPEERELINKYGTCWVVRVLDDGGAVACPNRRVGGSDVCAHHEKTNVLRMRNGNHDEVADVQPEQDSKS